MSLESNLTKYSVKDYYLNAGLCYLALPVSVDMPSPLYFKKVFPSDSSQILELLRLVSLFPDLSLPKVSLTFTSPPLPAPFLSFCNRLDLLSQDYQACTNAMSFYAQQDLSFPSTMEGRFLHNLLQAAEAGDVEGLDGLVQEFDRTKKILGWQAGVLRNVRKGVQEEPDLS